MSYLHQDITQMCIGAFYQVYNNLGHGFLEKVYENAMEIELKKLGLKVFRQMPIDVFYGEIKVGNYIADFCVEEKVILELKAAANLNLAHEAQLLNYLRATNIEVGLLLNFGEEAQIKRRILSNSKK